MILSVDPTLNNFGYAVFDKKDIVTVGVFKNPVKQAKNESKADAYKRSIDSLSASLTRLINLYKIDAVCGELVSFGSQSTAGALSTSIASSVIFSICQTRNLVNMWATVEDIKMFFGGSRDATKNMIMQKAAERHNWKRISTPVKDKSTREVIRHNHKYEVNTKESKQLIPAGTFEHIADAIAAYYTCVNQAKMRLKHGKNNT